MGVIFIGDRLSGKTHLAMELCNPRSQVVKVVNQNYDNLRVLLYDEDKEEAKPTDFSKTQTATQHRSLDVEVNLPGGVSPIYVDWIDTPGEAWSPGWQADNPQEWSRLLERTRDSEGILLVLSPYRELLKSGVDGTDYIRQKQWVNRFEAWVKFFRNECPNARRVGICLNKADLIADCNLDREASQLAYDPFHSKMTWQQRHAYVVSRYMRPIQPQLEDLNRSLSGGSVYCFLTSVHNRTLLELPWIYLASYLSV
jgi:hypothetical protein